MKKTLLFLFLGLGAAYGAQAQATLVHAVGAGIGLGRMMHKKSGDKPASKAEKADITTASYQGKEFPMLRTPADKLPAQGAEQLVELETQLTRCHDELLASPAGPICTPEQRAALQKAMVNVVQAKASRNLAAYQQEATFYLAEDARRQQAATPANPTN